MSVSQQIIAMMVPLTALLLSGGLGLHWVGGYRVTGIGHWISGHLLVMLGLVLVAFRQDLPLALSGAAGGPCILGGLLAVRLGLRRFQEKGGLAFGWWALLVGNVLFNALFFDLPPAHVRIAFNTATIALVLFGLSWELLCCRLGVFHRWIGGGLGLFVAGYQTVRAVSIAVSPEVTAPLAGGFYGVWAYIALIVWTRPTRW